MNNKDLDFLSSGATIQLKLFKMAKYFYQKYLLFKSMHLNDHSVQVLNLHLEENYKHFGNEHKNVQKKVMR